MSLLISECSKARLNIDEISLNETLKHLHWRVLFGRHQYVYNELFAPTEVRSSINLIAYKVRAKNYRSG